ncbi:MAG: ABC transporter ATP-binding protein, partial [Bacteroidaceae bacterium]|nr:ABC transporter ATP-binding protein [Bacteroidaceae bacterium]
MRYLAWFWKNSLGIRWNTAIRIVVGIVQVLLSLLMVWLSKLFIDETIHSGTAEDLVWMTVWLSVTFAASILLRQLYYYLSTHANVKQANQLRLELFSSLFRKELFKDDEFHSGDITSRLSKDIDVVTNATTEYLPQIIITMVQLTGAFLLLRFFDKRLAWSLLLLTPFMAIFIRFVSKRLRKMTHEIRYEESRIQMQVQEGMEYNALIRSMNSEQWIIDRLDYTQKSLIGKVLSRTQFSILTRTMLAFTFGFGYLFAFIWGGLQLRNGVITFGVMTSFLQLVGQIQSPLLQLLGIMSSLINSTASIDRLNKINTSLQCSFDNSYNPLCNIEKSVGVIFHDVCFKYENGHRNILTHFSYEFKPGSKTAILGETGVGKTTLFRLMLHFIQPTSGSIMLSNQLHLSDKTRPYFSYVPQGNTLMSGTIRFNLLIAKKDATDDELRKVLYAACADFVFDLPKSMDTELGERGKGLSEGQA